MAQKLLVVFGATGQQGGSVANFVASDPELSKQYRVRGITRDVLKPAAKELEAKGIEVVTADLNDTSTYASALQGAHCVFLMTSTIYDVDGKQTEVNQGKTLADASVTAGAKYIIFSTECDASTITGGKYPVDSFDGKAEVEQYIRQLPIQSAFFAPGSFMQNLQSMMAPRKNPDGSYSIANIVSGSAKLPWIDISEDTGKFVGAILTEPEKYNGTTIHAASCLHSFDEVAQMISKANGGKTVTYSTLATETFKGFLPPLAADTVANMFLYINDFGYYGPNESVEWAATNARGALVTMEDYIANNITLG